MSRLIVITGCSTGFGRDAALRFARNGDRVVATMRNSTGKNAENAQVLTHAASNERLDLSVAEMDVSSGESVNSAAKHILESKGTPDVLINNAGVMYLGISEAYTEEEFTNQLDVNVVGVHRVGRAFLPAMRRAKSGLIINVSSVAGRLSGPTFGIYCASKWALEAYSLAQRQELASSGIDVVVVEPGPFRTELFGQAPAPKDVDGRSATYPVALQEALSAMGSNFENMLTDESLPNDPALVVNAFLDLANMAPGARPFRTVVGLDFGVAEYNKSATEFDAQVAEGMGVKEIAKLH